MKIFTSVVIALLILVTALVGAGYYVVPLLVDREMVSLRTQIQTLSDRVQAVEKFVSAEQEARKSASLGTDTDLPKIVRAVNQLTARLEILEQTSRNENAQAADEQSKLKNEAEAWRKSQEQAVEELRKDLKEKSQAGLFAETLANIRGHLLKARIEMSLKNLAVAKTELDLIDGLFNKAAALTPQGKKSSFLKMQETVRNIKVEIDANFPAAANRLDLLWYEIEEFTAKPQANQ